MKISTLIVFLAVALAGCKKEKESIGDTFEEKIQDAAYGADPAQKMDVYLPASRSDKTPFVVILHGGSWVSGNKEEMRLIQTSLLQQGIASINMNYRYASPAHHFEGMMEDVEKALAFVRDHASEWQVKDKGMIVLGASAGAHIGLLYSYAYQQPGEVKAVISLSGPALFTTEYLGYAASSDLKQSLEYMSGATITGNTLDPRFSAASPANRVANIPTLLVHGTLDRVVPYQQAVLLQSLLQQKGVPNKLITVTGAGHDLSGGEMDMSKIMEEAVSWINTYSSN